MVRRRDSAVSNHGAGIRRHAFHVKQACHPALMELSEIKAVPAHRRTLQPGLEVTIMDIIVRFFLLLAAPITALFVSREAMNFGVIQVLVAIALFVGLVAALAFWPRKSVP
jgi:hypothetical protein